MKDMEAYINHQEVATYRCMWKKLVLFLDTRGGEE